MIYIIGVYLIVLGILFDEGSTLIVFINGLGILETNPIANRFGIIAFFIFGLCFYLALIWAWGFVIKLYRRFYEQRAPGYKLYDIVIFFFCILIVFTSAQKVEIGYNNIQVVIRTLDKDTAPVIQEQVEMAKEIKATTPDKFIELTDAAYKESTVSINYLQMIFYIIGGYLLFRVGYKVSPYEYG